MTGRRWSSLARAVALSSALAAGCTPLYLPPVPAAVPDAPVTSLGDASALEVVDGVLRLHVILAGVSRDGWLALQWYAPRGAEVASDSSWVEPSDVGTGRTFSLPRSIDAVAGEWRAVVSFDGRVVRQFRATVPAETGEKGP